MISSIVSRTQVSSRHMSTSSQRVRNWSRVWAYPLLYRRYWPYLSQVAINGQLYTTYQRVGSSTYHSLHILSQHKGIVSIHQTQVQTVMVLMTKQDGCTITIHLSYLYSSCRYLSMVTNTLWHSNRYKHCMYQVSLYLSLNNTTMTSTEDVWSGYGY